MARIWNKMWKVLLFAALIAKDVAMLIINAPNDCTDDTASGWDLNTWMIAVSSAHLCMICCITLICAAIISWVKNDEIEESCYLCMWVYLPSACAAVLWVFLQINTVTGFKYLQRNTSTGDQCDDIILAWLILDVFELVIVILLCCRCCWRGDLLDYLVWG